ncbi:hypothetical protein BpHYR1_040319 [Brachionus plicatilis]|uniref:Uncharacterized protein n=1 Tax=Brachionus plicatilis TaxID=10195 RepID=A0A3M7R8Z9_BRAPC|nr:hypothetical protein BpHYR1_040319 [Brachionus plicatilis]
MEKNYLDKSTKVKILEITSDSKLMHCMTFLFLKQISKIHNVSLVNFKVSNGLFELDRETLDFLQKFYKKSLHLGAVNKISLQNTLQFYAFCTPLKSIQIDCALTLQKN